MALYKAAEKILLKVSNHKGSVKNLVFAAKYRNPKQLFALICETLKYSEVLEEIIAQTQILKHVRGISKELFKLLIYDHLFGSGLRCGGKEKKVICKMQSMLHSALVRIKVKRGISRNEDLSKSNHVLPKYLRVNSLLTTMDDVLLQLNNDGYCLGSIKASQLGEKDFRVDNDIENLLVFNAKLDFHAYHLYTSGKVIFQDKASCFPAVILNPRPGTDVIDACAAPGNKTSCMASLMANSGKIFAFDLNGNRIESMKKLLGRAGVTNCRVKRSDFLAVDPLDPIYSNVSGILVDPSCSGSGIVSRMNHLTDSKDSVDEARLKSLSAFQLSMLNHAMSFPSATSVVYSTCSVHETENECVVKLALDQNASYELVKCLPKWPRRGHPVEGFDMIEAKKCVRCDPSLDETNGFFVALFRRRCGSKDDVSCSATKKKRKKRKRNKVPK